MRLKSCRTEWVLRGVSRRGYKYAPRGFSKVFQLEIALILPTNSDFFNIFL